MCGRVHGLHGDWHSPPLHRKGVHGAGHVCVLACGCRQCSMGVDLVHLHMRVIVRAAQCRIAGIREPCTLSALQHCRSKVMCAGTDGDAWKSMTLPWGGRVLVVGTVDEHCVGPQLWTTFHLTESRTCAMLA